MNTRATSALLLVLGNFLSMQAVAQSSMADMQFFSSHNAYQRSENEAAVWGSTNVLNMSDQIDELNIWHMELDIFAHQATCSSNPLQICELQPQPYQLWVGHTLFDGRGLNTLAYYLSRIATTQRLQDGFIVIHFSLTPNLDSYVPTIAPVLVSIRGAPPQDAYGNSWDDVLKAAILEYFPETSIYTQRQWELDGRVWPGPAELVERGFHVAFWAAGSQADNGFIFKTGNDGDPFNKVVDHDSTPASGVLSYRYPENVGEIDANWATAMDNGHHFVGTTEILARDGHPHFHPPFPTVVNLDFDPSCVSNPVASTGRGTWLDPHRGCLSPVNAVRRAFSNIDSWETNTGNQSAIPVILRAGLLTSTAFTITSGDADYVIDQSIILKNQTGVDITFD